MSDYRSNLWYQMGVKLELEHQREKERAKRETERSEQLKEERLGAGKQEVAGASTDAHPSQSTQQQLSKVPADLPEKARPLPSPPVSPQCPFCGRALRTGKAQQCFDCGMDWHDPKNVVCRQPGNNADPQGSPGMIRFNCPSCQKTLSAAQRLAGKPGKCPKCGQKMLIPATTIPASSAANDGSKHSPAETPLTPPVNSKAGGATPHSVATGDTPASLGQELIKRIYNDTFNESSIEGLIQLGADINARDKDGWTPLHWAAWRGQLNKVKTLVERGAYCTLTNNNGLTPEGVAAKRCKEWHAKFGDLPSMLQSQFLSDLRRWEEVIAYLQNS